MSKAWEATVRKSKKRANSIFSSMSVAHADDEDNSEVEHAEMNLANGDYYNGQWADNFPTGQGKYIWTDGCMYVGEWFRGKTMGKGRFSWPTGATYEGDFKNGYMDGKGTFIGSFGDTYRGSWLMNLKHGKGVKSYANGDWYEGEWRKGTQNGQGRYQWKNGSNYVGRWRNGLMNGEGTMIWADGKRYDGSWEGGLPKGTGTFKRYDESFYVGIWSNNPKDQSGTYYPVSSGDKDWDPQEVFSLVSNGCKICPDEKVPVLPSQKVYNWFSSKGSSRPRRTSVDDRFSSYNLDQCDSSDVSESLDGNLREVDEGLGNLNINEVGSRTTRMPPVRIQPVRREGVAITKGHKNYDLMLNLQLGVRHTVGKPAPATTSLDLKGSAFDPKDKVWTKFPCAGSKHTLPHTSTEFKWKDYCPVVFRTLRKLFGVDPADYMLSICGNAALRELSSQGKSGSFFYLTNDDKYMIKTVKKAENKLLLRMLPAYYNHVRAFENTLVTKFYGVHCVKPYAGSQKKVRFVIMGNLFCSKYSIHRRFDLKGSSYGRTTDRHEAEIDHTRTLKDLDLNFIFRLQKIWFQDFCRQVDRDCDFLEQEKIMDYSMLVGIHFCETSVNPETQMAEACPRTPTLSRASTTARSQTGNGDLDHNNGGVRLSRADVDHFFDPSRWPSIRLGVNMPAMVEQTVRTNDNDSQQVGEPSGEYYEVILYFGIIDILQDYDISKKLEHAYKSIQHDPTSISAVDPKQYSKRFRDFIFKIFTQDTR